MKNRIKNISVIFTVILLLSTIIPSTTVLASELDTKQKTFLQEDNKDELQEFKELNEIFSNEKKKDEFRTYAKEIGIELDSEVMYINDNQLTLLFEFMGYDLSQYRTENNIQSRSSGVTKVVSKGKGSWDVYLSASFLRNYYGAGGILSAGLAVAIGLLSGGVLLGVSAAMLTALSNHIKGEIKHGVLVRVRKWKISSISNQ